MVVVPDFIPVGFGVNSSALLLFFLFGSSILTIKGSVHEHGAKFRVVRCLVFSTTMPKTSPIV